MASSGVTASETAAVRKGLDVRLPVELLWMIIEMLAASSEPFELMYLREVNSMLWTGCRDNAESTDVYRDLRSDDHEGLVPVGGFCQPHASDQR